MKYKTYSSSLPSRGVLSTDKRIDVWSWDFIIWKIDYGLWSGLDCENKQGLGRLWETFETFFLRYYRQKFNLKSFKKYSRVRIKKLYRIKVNKSQKKKIRNIFYGGKTSFFSAKKFECKYMKVGTRHLLSYLCFWMNEICIFLTVSIQFLSSERLNI